jgi:putative phage-type endonuclease
VNPAKLVQGSPEWRQYRVGRVGASCIADLMARTKTGWGASRANLMADLIAERLTGVPIDGYTNAAMQHGIDTEPLAADAASFRLGLDLAPVGFIDHPDIAMTGASPDRLIEDDALAEIKCPNTATHIDTLLTGAVPDKYVKQMQWQLACSGRRRALFISFDPRLPERLRLFTRWFERDDVAIADMEKHVRDFLKELDEKIAALNALALKEAA